VTDDFVSRPVRASTQHRCFSSRRADCSNTEKVWRLPLAAPNARGKALINILPLSQATITTIMPAARL